MKKGMFVVVACIATCLSVAQANAQSSVTLYGVLDGGMTYANNVRGEKQIQANGGGLFGERWGIKGLEDLGGGVRTIFTLEGGFTSSTGALGQGGLEFGRQAFIGVTSEKSGALTLGRQYDSIADTLAYYGSGLMYNGYYTVHLGDFDHLAGERTNSSVKYVSPSFGGFTFQAMYGFGGVPGSIATGSTIGAGLKYAANGLTFGLATLTVRNANVDLNSTFGITNLDGVSFSVGKNLLQTSSLAIYGVGGSYALGNATISAVYTQTHANKTSVSGKKFGTLIARIGELGITYQVTASLMVGMDYTYTKLGQFMWQEPGLAFHYFLSKKTDVYAAAAYQHAFGAAQYANIFTVGSSSTENQVVARIGLRHFF